MKIEKEEGCKRTIILKTNKKLWDKHASFERRKGIKMSDEHHPHNNWSWEKLLIPQQPKGYGTTFTFKIFFSFFFLKEYKVSDFWNLP